MKTRGYTNMKVLLVNGSAHLKGCTYTALSIIAQKLNENNIETEIIQLGAEAVRDCIGCYACKKTGNLKCIYNDDIVNDFIEKAKAADGFIFGSPVYYAHPSGRLLSFMDRVFFAGKDAFQYKPAAAVVSARRAGTSASLDVITKHFTISNMPVVSSNYWCMVHGSKPEDVFKDEEGVQNMQTLGENMAWYLKSFEAAKEQGIVHPPIKEIVRTDFIKST